MSNKKVEGISFDRYYSYEEINKYLDNLPKFNKNIKVRSGGKSFEGRDIKHVIITNGDGRKKNSVLIDAGIHAREWIAPATALYLIDQLANPTSDLSKLLEKIDFVIHPLINPDGYEFSRLFFRLWRKTRSRNNFVCDGTDGNRNFDFHWGEVGSSENVCSDIYQGKTPFSEAETKVIRDTAKGIKDTCKFYLTLHSFGKYLLYPWGYTSELPDTWKEIHEIAEIGADAIRRKTGTNYTVGSSTNTLYAAAGGSDDYMFGVMKIPIAITMELPGGGNFGFDLPPSKIKETVEESAEGIFAMVNAVADKFK